MELAGRQILGTTAESNPIKFDAAILEAAADIAGGSDTHGLERSRLLELVATVIAMERQSQGAAVAD